MTKKIILLIIMAIATIETGASAAPSPGIVSMNLITTQGKIDIAAGSYAALMGIYPEIITNSAKLSSADGSLVMGDYTETGKETDTAGVYVNSTVYLKGQGGKNAVAMTVTMYPEINAAAVSIYNAGAFVPRPDGGIKLVVSLAPGFEKGMAAERFKQFWTRPVFLNNLPQTPDHTQYLLWKDKRAGYIAAAPLVGGGMKGEFVGEGEGFAVKISGYDAGFKPKTVPAFAVAWGDNPYDATRRLYRVALALTGDEGKPRTEKAFPEIFNKIGWCSWNAFYDKVTRDNIIESAESFRKANFPVGFFLVDDGWQQTNEQRRLTGFGADENKFPGGLAPMIRTLKEDYKIPRVGFWHAYQGYWEGVQPGSELAKKYASNLFESLTGNLVPHPMDRQGYRFFFDYHKALRDAGADFVKVDNQSSIAQFTVNRLPIGNAARGWQQNLQASANANFDGALVNCMCMTIENIYSWGSSNISRSSDDFFPDVAGNPRRHAIDNIYNSLWYSELTWPDFDMFQSHHPQAVFHAALRAISGGPVYITDTPGKQNWDLLRKLVYSDGTVLRSDEPARPTKDMLFEDPFTNPVPLKAFARVGDGGAIAAFNALDGGGAVAGAVAPEDIEGLSGDEFVMYEHFSGKARKARRADREDVSLNEYGATFYNVVPFTCGATPVGLLDKFLSYRAVEKVVAEGSLVKVRIRGGGLFGAYMETKPASVSIGARKLKNNEWSYENNMLKFQVPDGENIWLEINAGKCDCGKK